MRLREQSILIINSIVTIILVNCLISQKNFLIQNFIKHSKLNFKEECSLSADNQNNKIIQDNQKSQILEKVIISIPNSDHRQYCLDESYEYLKNY